MGINDDADLDTGQVQDLRGSGGSGAFGRLPGGGFTAGGGILGLIVVIVLGVLGGTGHLGLGGDGGQGSGGDLAKSCSAADPDRFERTDCRNVLYVNSVQAYWRGALPASFHTTYRTAPTRFFSQVVRTGCGQADSGVGPFYCPADEAVYIDLSFYDQLAGRQFGAPGDFAQAYVLAHEYGHHVQTLLGTEQKVRAAQQRDPGNANRYSIALELQADCYAGAWARHAAQTTDEKGNHLFTAVTPTEIDQALTAAQAVGDDTIQSRSGGGIHQESWTHGSGQQRQHWFATGYDSGDPTACRTFD
ncbi:KPN_02809 family neutral zinc metallopeptidase [Actinocatenispora comari]|uniref:Membrane protein n=1 Tax=Actinocatenispora comari TaxID=2807577 RepID=A0A8J4AD32_9ACTN|nr:neutral zinc metallopeptidase [Actinocatenispora comari]GIL26493.1 membrane protein [Actinocatenispora comari]